MKTTKQVTVLARYAHKRDGKLTGVVTYAVRSSRSNECYYVTLAEGKAMGCNCPSRKPCYHMTQLEQKEADRKKVASRFAAKSAPSWLVNLVNAGQVVAPNVVEAVSPKIEQIAQELDIPAEEVARIAEIAADYQQEIKPKHTDLVLPIGPRDTKKGIKRKSMMDAPLTHNSGFSLLKVS